MRTLKCVALALLAGVAFVSPALSQDKTAEGTAFPAVLAGHVVLPAATFVPAPTDAPDALKTSGKSPAPTVPALMRSGQSRA